MDSSQSVALQYLLGNLTYVLIAASYLVRDMLKLRTLAIVASCSSIVFMLLRQNYLVVGWNLFFVTVNVVQLAILIYERRPVRLTPEQAALYEQTFQAVTKRDFLRLLDRSRIVQEEDGAVLVEEGERLRDLMLVLDGRARVLVHGEEVAQVKPGLFIGEMSYLTEAPATARVLCDGPVRLVAWDKAELRDFLARRDALRYALRGILGLDLTKKIRKADGLKTTAGAIPLEALTRA